MNREIKFRAWDSDLELMMPEVDLSQALQHYKWLGRKDLPLMQYTGLKDKNGKEIYEGDIVSDGKENRGGDNRTVVWDEEDAGWFPFSQCSDPYIGIECGNELSVKECEVIGNIYENPELIK